MHKIVILGYAGSAHIRRWVLGLASLGYDIHLISCGGIPINGIETTILGEKSGAWNYIKYTARARSKILATKPDLIHSFQATGYAIWGAAKYNCPKLLTPLGSDILISPNRTILHKLLIYRYLKQYDHFTTASRHLKDALNSFCPFSGDRTTVIPFGVRLSDKTKKHESKIPIRIIFAKSLQPVYAPQILLEAISIATKKNFKLTLDMYGEGELRDNLQELAVKLNISDIVSFKGWINNEILYDLYPNYDIMIMPSLSESFGVAALEASSAGLPVIASNIGGVPEVVKDGVTGILVEPGDPEKLAEAILKLASDVELRKKMGNAGREFVAQNYRWENCLKQMIELYEQLISGKQKN
jgi:glycosyltransferase involved in cell wall biosynthesis